MAVFDLSRIDQNLLKLAVAGAKGKKNALSDEIIEIKADILEARLRREMHRGRLPMNSRFDREDIKALIILAGYHIEAGSSKFSEFSQKMVNDLGEAMIPFNRIVYNTERDWTVLNEIELDSYETVYGYNICNNSTEVDLKVDEEGMACKTEERDGVNIRYLRIKELSWRYDKLHMWAILRVVWMACHLHNALLFMYQTNTLRTHIDEFLDEANRSYKKYRKRYPKEEAKEMVEIMIAFPRESPNPFRLRISDELLEKIIASLAKEK